MHSEDDRKNLKAQAFTFHITLRDPTALTDLLIPELHRLSAGTHRGNYNSDKKNLSVNINIPRVDYNDFKVDSLILIVTSDADLLKAKLNVVSITDSTFRVTNLQFSGNAGHDSIEVVLQSTRNNGFKKIFLAGEFHSVPEGYKLRLNKDGIVFQNLPWNVPSDNYLLFGKNQFIAHNVVLRNAGQSFSLNSTDEKNQRSPLKVEI